MLYKWFLSTLLRCIKKNEDFVRKLLVGQGLVEDLLIACRLLLPSVCVRSILHIAVKKGNLAILSLLLNDLSNGEKYDQPEALYMLTYEEDGFTPYDLAILMRQMDMAHEISRHITMIENQVQRKYDISDEELGAILREEKAQLQSENERGDLPEGDPFHELGNSIRNINDIKYNKLLKSKDLFTLLDNRGDTVLNHAIDVQNDKAISLILDSTAKDTIKNKFNVDGNYALMYAVEKKDAKAIDTLLSKECRILLPNNASGCPKSIIHLAIEHSDAKILDILLKELLNRKKYTTKEVEYIIHFKAFTIAKVEVDAHHMAQLLGDDQKAGKIQGFLMAFEEQVDQS